MTPENTTTDDIATTKVTERASNTLSPDAVPLIRALLRYIETSVIRDNKEHPVAHSEEFIRVKEMVDGSV